ncbi:cupin domain-containing protein [bacterium D16-51]|nr:cupin domain-containing protein [bacterium D16-59]RKI56981.1 cupin domain-containing protein [bacterium D16-51]
MLKIVEPDFLFEDARGKLVQLAHAGFEQVNYVFSAGGSFRGGHYHKENAECFYVISGRFKIAVEMDGKREEHIFGAGDMFCVPPMAAHSFSYLEDTQLIALYDRGVEHPDGTKDIYEYGI